jgi:hypothetical protein
MVQHVFNMHKTMGSIPSTQNRKPTKNEIQSHIYRHTHTHAVPET